MYLNLIRHYTSSQTENSIKETKLKSERDLETSARRAGDWFLLVLVLYGLPRRNQAFCPLSRHSPAESYGFFAENLLCFTEKNRRGDGAARARERRVEARKDSWGVEIGSSASRSWLYSLFFFRRNCPCPNLQIYEYSRVYMMSFRALTLYFAFVDLILHRFSPQVFIWPNP